MKKSFVLLLSVLWLSVCAQVTSSTFDPEWAAKFQAAIDNAMPTSGIHGVSVAITFPGMGTFIGVGGESAPGVPVTPDMQFGIGSNTKLFTAVLALKLQELGYFSLDDPLSAWIPSFNYIDPSATLRQCLGHQTGFFDFSNDIDPTDYAVVYGPDTAFTPAGIMARIGPPHFPVGNGFAYSNTNYTLVALAIEAATGRTYLENLHQYIFDPLDMDSTFLAAYETPNGNVCDGWYYDDDLGNVPLTAPYSMYWSAGSIFSTACEMAQWYNHLFEGDIISAASLEELTRFEPASFYGLGEWYIYYPPLPDDQVNGHSGEVPGYTSQMAFDVKRHMVLTLLTNQGGDIGGQMGNVLFPLVLQAYEEYTRKANDAGITQILEPTSSYCISTIQPKVTLKNFGTSNLTLVSIHYQLDDGADQTYAWTGNLANNQIETVALPIMIVSAGQHHFYSHTTSPNLNPEGYTFNDGARSGFQVYGSSSPSGLQEGFEGAFPSPGWNNGNGTLFDWNKTALTSYSGDACLVKNMWNDNSGRAYDLDMPWLDLSSFANPVLAFQYAYGYYGQGFPDDLEILISDDCGESYHSLFHKSGTALRTANATDIFFPNHNQWRLKTFNLSAYRDEVMIKFRATTANGNNLYIDDLSVSDKSESCPAPTNLEATNITSIAARLNWQAYGAIDHFDVYYHRVGEGTWSHKTVNGNKRWVQAQSLSPATDYEFYVISTCSSGNSLPSELSLFTTSPQQFQAGWSSGGAGSLTVFPNPVGLDAQIQFTLDQPGKATIQLMDVSGRIIQTIADRTFEAGEQELNWNAAETEPGYYFISLASATTNEVKEICIVR